MASIKKYKILCLFLITFSIIGYSQSIENVKWYNIEEAQKLNIKNPKYFIIDVYTDWCGWCIKMDQLTFNNPGIASYLNEKYYPVKFNAETKDSIVFAGHIYKNQGGGRQPHDLAIALLQGKMSYPSVAYMNEKLELLSTVPGFYTAEQIEPILMYFGEGIYKTTSWQDYRANFKSVLFKQEEQSSN
ncbi:MAG: DUF255 domain-containing protein [Bacteroidales bacterium]|nr:DUF255 domain-containing protein [Bacteroidales bacterium]